MIFNFKLINNNFILIKNVKQLVNWSMIIINIAHL